MISFQTLAWVLFGILALEYVLGVIFVFYLICKVAKALFNRGMRLW